jgi:hypothetical protein
VSNAQLIELDAHQPSMRPCKIARFTDALVENGYEDAAVVVASVAGCDEQCWLAGDSVARNLERALEPFISPCDLARRGS